VDDHDLEAALEDEMLVSRQNMNVYRPGCAVEFCSKPHCNSPGLG